MAKKPSAQLAETPLPVSVAERLPYLRKELAAYIDVSQCSDNLDDFQDLIELEAERAASEGFSVKILSAKVEISRYGNVEHHLKSVREKIPFIPRNNTGIIPQPRITGEKDEGSVSEPQTENLLEWRGQKYLVQPESAALIDALLMTKAELAEHSKAEPDAAPIKPFPELSPEGVAAVIAHGKKRPWGKRREFKKNNYKWNTDVFKFVQAEYGDWIPGLTQGHLKSADEDLWNFFKKRVCTVGLPEWLDVPSEPDATLRKISNPIERAQRIIARDVYRNRSQTARDAKRPKKPATTRGDISRPRR
jgi:hypothetical protein